MVAKMLLWKAFPWKWIIYLQLSIYCFAEPEPSDPSSRHFQPLAGKPRLKPRITEHPQDGYFAKNEPTTLNCKAEGKQPLTVTWYKDGKLVQTNKENPLSHRMLLNEGNLFFLTVIHTKHGDSDIGQYYCNATNIYGSAISSTANIQIAVLKGEFKEEPVDTTTAVGKTVVFHCKPPRGKPEPKVIWHKDGEILHPNDRIEIREDGDLVINDVEKKDMGEYVCFAINTGGEKNSQPAKLRVLDVPVFHKLPQDINVNQGKDALFYCDVVGDPPIKIQWSKNGGLISYGRARILSDKTLRIEKVEPSDEGVYECTAENAAGSTRASARLVVSSPPSFLIQPKDQVVAKGRTVTLQCVAKGNPPPTVFWRKDDQDTLMFPNRDSGGRISVAEDGTFRIAAVNESDAGTYICEALNTKGQVSAKARIRVVEHDPRPPPVIKIGPQNQTLPVDTVGLLRCMVGGDPHPIVRWYKDSRPMALSEPRFTLLDSGTLQISDLMVQDSGTYTCKAISETGETTWSAYLLVDADSSFTPVRSAATSALPDPPTKPVVSDVTDSTVHLSWAPGIQVGPSPVIAFHVQYFGYDTTDGWITASGDVKRESYTVEKLRPDVSYIFIVRAVTVQGIGPPSLPSVSIRTLPKKQEKPDKKSGVLSEEDIKRKLSGKVIELTNTRSINDSSISLTWKVLKSDGIVEGFQIEYRHIINMRRLDYGKMYSVRVPPTLTTYTLTGLMSYTWYEICVLGFSSKVKSRCSSPVKVQTEKHYTPEAPGLVHVEKVTDTSVSISWTPPDLKKGHMVTAYVVSCGSADKKHNCSLMTNGRTLDTVIKSLRRNKSYMIKVAAETHLGMGSWSSPYIFSKGEVHAVGQIMHTSSTLKPIANEGPEEVDLFKKSWFLGLLIGTVGVMLWLLLCIFSIWLCKKKKNKKKMKDQRFYTGVPLKADEHNRNMMYPPQYGIKDPQMNFSNELPPELCVLLPHGKKEQEINEDNIYKMAGDGSFPEMKTFYQKQDVAPYATTALIQKQHLMKQRQQGLDHMFRPINQGYMHYSEGSGDSCQKQALSVDSNHDNSRGSTTDHNHSDNMQSPTSDSGSHTTDENGLLIKEKKKNNSRKDVATPKQVVVNWSDMLPPPPDHPPPSECGEPPLYSEIRSADEHSSARSPVSPVSFSQLSACSCPNPHTQTPVSGWNMPMYSDNDCPRCHSEKYYDPATYCHQEAYVKRTHSPRTHLLQHANVNRNPQNNFNAHHSPRGTPSVIYQYSQPQRGQKSNFATLHGDRQSSNVNRVSASSHSDNETQSSAMPCFHSYKINPKNGEKDYRFLREKESCPEPAPPFHHCGNDSGMGMEEEGTCMERGCQSVLPIAAVDCLNNSLYRPQNVMSSSGHGGYARHCDSPVSEGADYATESDLEQQTDQSQNWNVPVDQHTDCSSVRSSTCSSGDGTFLSEADFASAVARAAEMSGLTVVGTTVCDPQPKKKERRHRRPARPISPGYSTDSNYGSIDVVHRPYPKSERKKQLIEQGKLRGHQRLNDMEGQMSRSLHSESNIPHPSADNNIPRNIPLDNTAPVYDTPYGRAQYVMHISSPVSPMTPTRLSTLKFIQPLDGSTVYSKGGHSGYLQHNSSQPIREDVV